MRAVGIKTLKNKLSEYVRVAAEGETILVTGRDRVVAELGPPQGARRRRQRCVAGRSAAAWLAPAACRGLDRSSSPAAGDGIAEVLRDLDADRGDR